MGKTTRAKRVSFGCFSMIFDVFIDVLRCFRRCFSMFFDVFDDVLRWFSMFFDAFRRSHRYFIDEIVEFSKKSKTIDKHPLLKITGLCEPIQPTRGGVFLRRLPCLKIFWGGLLSWGQKHDFQSFTAKINVNTRFSYDFRSFWERLYSSHVLIDSTAPKKEAPIVDQLKPRLM